MKCINLTSEEKLKDAAKSVFLRKGFAGTTARDISEAAGMNIALTNYYFRSKEKLFIEIFKDLFKLYFKNVVEIFNKPITFREKITEIIEEDYRMLKEEPNLAIFIMNELHRDCENLLPELSRLKDILGKKLDQQIKEEVAKGNMRNIEVQHIMPIIIGSIQFVFLGRSMTMKIHNMSDEEYDLFTERHKNHVIGMVDSYLFNTQHQLD